MADPAQILRVLHLRGVDVRLDNGRLIARPAPTGAVDLRFEDSAWRACTPDPGPLPADMVRFITHFKPLIIEALEAHQRGDTAA